MTVRIGTGSSAVDPSALRVAGVSPSKVMLGTGSSAVEAWTAVITVTPQAPTFLTASPWYTLPTQAGVTYTVSGTPGYNQSVTITATPQAGYALAGTLSWTHTYPSMYPLSGSWGPETVATQTRTTFDSHTITESGTFVITHTVTRHSGSATFRSAINLLGKTIEGAEGSTPRVVEYTETLSVGDLVDFRARNGSTGTNSLSGSWSIVKR